MRNEDVNQGSGAVFDFLLLSLSLPPSSSARSNLFPFSGNQFLLLIRRKEEKEEEDEEVEWGN